MAQAVSPNIPAPTTPTLARSRSPQTLIAPATVAVAQLAGQATAIGSASSITITHVPGASRQYSASPPVKMRRPTADSWPYFTPIRHFCG